MLSDGSFSGKRSFATLHPAFVNQAFLNRHEVTEGLSIITSSQAIQVPPRKQKAVWLAPEGLVDSAGKPIRQKPGLNLTIVRVGLRREALGADLTFTPSQLRLICKKTTSAKDLFAGKAINVYPFGHLELGRLQKNELNDLITKSPSDFDGPVLYIDFAFYVPNDFVPVLVEFKANSIARLPLPVRP